MASDYSQILEDNLVEYGKGTCHLSYLGELYTERTHFVFEILQNAEDAGASKILFRLHSDKLEILHDGKVFNERDVRGICGIRQGNKDSSQIGKFGIGFKSVYAYTKTPEIHSGDEHFRIEHYVRPYPAAACEIGQDWTTLFIFPLNSEEVPAYDACQEIAHRLECLSASTLLFLRHLEEIKYQLPGGTEGHYLRDRRETPPVSEISVLGKNQTRVSEITILGKNRTREESETWLVLSRPLRPPALNEDVWTKYIEFAFRLDVTKDGRRRIQTISSSPLVVYFPTDKETHMGFLIQGPFRTTPSRDNIRMDDSQNIELIRDAASLAREALSELKNQGLLTASSLQAFPIRKADFPDDGPFHPIYQAVKAAFLNEPYLPTADGSFVSGKLAKLHRGADVASLIDHDQLAGLCGSGAGLKWLSKEITLDRTPELHKYLRDQLEIEEISPEVFARRVSDTFLSQQSDLWLISFYAYLSGQEALWKKPTWRGDGGPLRTKAFIRLADNSMCKPFAADGNTLGVFLPPPEETDFPIVKRDIAADKQAYEFLKVKLGLSEPDIFDEVLKKVLPRYANPLGQSQRSKVEHAEDIKKIMRALRSDSKRVSEVIVAAKMTRFLHATDASGNILLKTPTEVYFDTKDLRLYFEQTENIWFVCETGLISDYDTPLLAKLGVIDLPRRIPCSDQPPLHFKAPHSARNSQSSTLNYDLEGLGNYLNSLSNTLDPKDAKDRSLRLWCFLLKHLEKLPYGFFKGDYTYSWHGTRTTHFDARFLERLLSVEWLVTKQGTVERPSDVCIEDLCDDYRLHDRADALIEELGVKTKEQLNDEKAEKSRVAQIIGIDSASLECIKQNPTDFERWVNEQKIAISKARTHSPAKTANGFSTPSSVPAYSEAFQDAMNPTVRYATDRQDKDEQDLEPVADPARRRQKESEAAAERRDNEPSPEQRRRITERTVLEGPSEEVRKELTEWYGGRCQICGDHFNQRHDGRPFFIAKYMVDRTHSRAIDCSGNVLCLCANHFARWQHGQRSTDADFVQRILSLKTKTEGAAEFPQIEIDLCGKRVQLRFHEKHLIALQSLFAH